MQSYPDPTISAPLAEHHLRQLEESAIAPEVIAERGVRSIEHGCDLPDVFSRRQKARAPGILFTVPRPNGETSHCFKPDEPDPENPGHKYEQPPKKKPGKKRGGPGNVLGVHPGCHRLIGRTDVPVIFVEGIKKGDAILSAARAAGVEILVVVILGVWNWLSDGKPIPDMFDIPVEGRKASICFDSDMLSNPNVQDAARRLAGHLLSRGAIVYVTYLRDAADGSKVGADDFLAVGGTLAELRALTRAYDPGDFVSLRLSQDGKLRAALRYLRKEWLEGDWMRFVGRAERGNWQRGHTARDTKEALIRLGESRGKWDGRGVVVRVGLRHLSEKAGKTAPSVGKAVEHLAADGQLEIIAPEDGSKARSYRLLVPRAALYSMEGEDGDKGKEGSLGEPYPRCKGLRAPSAPRLRWSSPARPRRREFETVPGRGVVRHTGRVSRDATPEELAASPCVKRLGPHRGAILDALEAAGGELHEADLRDALNRTSARPRDFRSRILKPLEEAGIIRRDGDVVRLAPDWLDKLEAERECKGEIDQAERQAKKHRDQSISYREHLGRGRRGTPKASLEAVRRTKEMREMRMREMREEDRRDRAPTPPAVEALVKRIMAQHDRMRLGLLCEIAREDGLRWRDVSPVVKRMGYRIERLPEHKNAEFVFSEAEGVA